MCGGANGPSLRRSGIFVLQWSPVATACHFPKETRYERRIHRSPTGDQVVSRGTLGRGHLPHCGTLSRLVPPVAAPLRRPGSRRLVLSPPRSRLPTPHFTGTRAHDPECAPSVGIPSASGDAL